MTTYDPHDAHSLPPDLAEADRALRSLGAADRAAAREGIEDRLAQASRPALLAAAAGGASAATEVVARIGPGLRVGNFVGARLAAGIAILGACAAAWLALRVGGGTPAMAQSPTLEEDLDSWMSIAFDNPFTGALDELRTDAPAIPLDGGEGWQFDDFDLSEGSS